VENHLFLCLLLQWSTYINFAGQHCCNMKNPDHVLQKVYIFIMLRIIFFYVCFYNGPLISTLQDNIAVIWKTLIMFYKKFTYLSCWCVDEDNWGWIMQESNWDRVVQVGNEAWSGWKDFIYFDQCLEIGIHLVQFQLAYILAGISFWNQGIERFLGNILGLVLHIFPWRESFVG
jgi:hypothetical protein